MTPLEIIQQFRLETSTDAKDFEIAADCADDHGLAVFADLLRQEHAWLMSRKDSESLHTATSFQIDRRERSAAILELPATEAYWILLNNRAGGYGDGADDGSGQARFYDDMPYRYVPAPIIPAEIARRMAERAANNPNPTTRSRRRGNDFDGHGWGLGQGDYGSPPENDDEKRSGQGYAFCFENPQDRREPVGYGMGNSNGKGHSDPHGIYRKYAVNPHRRTVAGLMKKLQARLTRDANKDDENF